MAEKHPALNTMKHEEATSRLKWFSCCGYRLESRKDVLLFLGTLGAVAEVLMGPTQAFRVASLQGAYNNGAWGFTRWSKCRAQLFWEQKLLCTRGDVQASAPSWAGSDSLSICPLVPWDWQDTAHKSHTWGLHTGPWWGKGTLEPES